MAPQRSVGFCLDESMGRKLAAILRDLRAPAAPAIHDLRDLGLSGVTDEVLMGELTRRGIGAMVTRDSAILRATVRRDVWKVTGIGLFILEGKWGNLRLFDQGRSLLWWWPHLVTQLHSGPAGAAWKVPTEFRSSGLKRQYPTIDRR